MADRLTAQQFTDFSGNVMRRKVTRTATIDNGSISATDISTRVKKWGSLKFEVYNQSPSDRGGLRFPVLEVQVDNSDGFFDRGGTIFPNPSDDFEDTTLRIVVVIDSVTWLDFTGVVKEPEYRSTGALRLVAEHPLTAVGRRKWTGMDRIGGDTGVNLGFA